MASPEPRPRRMGFQKRTYGDDGLGGSGTVGPFETVFTVWVWMKPLRGSEAVMGDRLSGRQPYVAKVRQSSQTRQITSDWQIVDPNIQDRVLAVVSPPADPDGKGAWLEMIATEGVVS